MFAHSMITTIGTTTRDIFVFTDGAVLLKNPNNMLVSELIAFERAGKTTAQDMQVLYGGGAANTAVSFARLGLRPAIITAIGDDVEGLACCSNLRREGVSLRHIQRVPGGKTAAAIIIQVPKSQSHAIIVHRGASLKLKLTSHELTGVRTPWVYLTAVSGPSSARALATLFSHAKVRKSKVAWNPGSEQLGMPERLLRAYIAATEVCMVNRDEALELLSRTRVITKPVPTSTLARLIGRYGARYTVVTDGHKGAYVSVAQKVLYQPAKIGRTVNKTGAGDAFGSGFVAGLILFHGDVHRALRLAQHTSYSVVQRIGAQTGLLSRSDVKRYHI